MFRSVPWGHVGDDENMSLVLARLDPDPHHPLFSLVPSVEL